MAIHIQLNSLSGENEHEHQPLLASIIIHILQDWLLISNIIKKISKSSPAFAKTLKHTNERITHERLLSCLILALIWFGRVKELRSNAIDVLSPGNLPGKISDRLSVASSSESTSWSNSSVKRLLQPAVTARVLSGEFQVKCFLALH